jgi:hypothetical protein
MAQAPASIFKIPTESPQPVRGRASRARKAVMAPTRAASRVAGIETRAATRGTPVIGAVTCQDITVNHAQKIVNAAPTAGEGNRVHRMLSAMVGAGLKGGYLVNSMLAGVHWQAGDRPLPAAKVTVAGESVLLVDPSEIPSSDDIGALGRALAARTHGKGCARRWLFSRCPDSDRSYNHQSKQADIKKWIESSV